MNENTMSEIKDMITELKIPGIRQGLTAKIADAYKINLSYEELLKDILREACDVRKENGKKNRIRNANFPYKKYLEDLVWEYLPEQAQKKLKELKTLKFIEEARNVIFAGNPGTGNYRKFYVIERLLIHP